MPALINLREVPLGVDMDLYDFLQQVRNVVVNLVQTSVVEPRPVVNFTVTPGPGSNLVQFTRSDGDAYAVYVNEVAELNGATRYDLGLGNSFMHDLGIGGETRYYWVRTKLGPLECVPVGPIASETLPLTTPIAIPPEPPGSETPTFADDIDAVVPGRPLGAALYKVDL